MLPMLDTLFPLNDAILNLRILLEASLLMLEMDVELWTSELVVISELGSDLLLATAHRLQCCTNGKAAKANIIYVS